MTIEDVQKAKEGCEKEIRAIIGKFCNDTGVKFSKLNIYVIQDQGFGCSVEYSFEVELEVKL